MQLLLLFYLFVGLESNNLKHQNHRRRHSVNCVCSSTLPDHGQSVTTDYVLLSGQEIARNTECTSIVQNAQQIDWSKSVHLKRNRKQVKGKLETIYWFSCFELYLTFANAWSCQSCEQCQVIGFSSLVIDLKKHHLLPYPNRGQSLTIDSALLSGRKIARNTECASSVQNLQQIEWSKSVPLKRNSDCYCLLVQTSEASVSQKEAFYKLRLFITFARSRSKSYYWLRATIWPRDYAQHGMRFNCAERAMNWLVQAIALKAYTRHMVSEYGWQTRYKSQLYTYNSQSILMFAKQYLNFDCYCVLVQTSEASVSRKEAFYKLRLFIDIAWSRSKSNYWFRATIWPRDYAQYGMRFNCAERAMDWLIKISAFEEKQKTSQR